MITFIAYKIPFADFPKDCRVTFHTHIDWTSYGNEAETIVKPGMLDVPIAPLPYVTIWQDMLKGNEDELKKMKKNPFSDYS